MKIGCCIDCKFVSHICWNERTDEVCSFYCEKHKDLFYEWTFCESYQRKSSQKEIVKDL